MIKVRTRSNHFLYRHLLYKELFILKMMQERLNPNGINMVDSASNAENLSPGKSERKNEFEQIDQLSAVFSLSRKRKKGGLVYIGWTIDGRPKVAYEEDSLTQDAQKSLKDFQRAFKSTGGAIREIGYREIEAVNMAYFASVKDYKDINGIKAEDLIVYGTTDENGDEKEITLGELEVLQAIVEAEPWQCAGGELYGGLAAGAGSMYFLIVPHPEKGRQVGLAILFETLVKGEGNEEFFKLFVADTLGSLIQLDLEQKSEKQKKGYYRVARELAQRKPSVGPVDVLLDLRKLGVIRFDDREVEKFRERERGMIASGLSLAKKLRLINIRDEEIEMIRKPHLGKEVKKLNIDRLMRLARTMYSVAYRSLRH